MNAYLLTSELYNKPGEEISLIELKEYTDNVIVLYNEDFNKFRNLLYALDTLKFNIGVAVDICIYNLDIYDFIDNIKGFNIKLGVWVPYNHQYQLLSNKYKRNFIIGEINNKTDSQIPRLGTSGDIELGESKYIDSINKEIQELKINTDFVTIYNENNLKPIPSTYIYS